MTVEEYRSKYGTEFRLIMGQPAIVALMQVLESDHPVKKLRNRAEGEKLNGAPLFLAQIDGYELALHKIRECAELIPEPPKEHEPDYSEEEQIGAQPVE